MDIPQKYKDLVGTKQVFSGCLFSQANDMPKHEYDVLKIRLGSGVIMDMEAFKPIHPTFDLLLKREGMKQAQWAKGFPICEIELRDDF